MPKGVRNKVDYDAEIALIDEIIGSHRKEISQLAFQRQLLLSKKQHADMDIVLEYIIKNGLTADEVLEMINKAVNDR